MTDLYPTKTRLELLCAVEDGEVVWWPASAGDEAWACQYTDSGDRKVTARILQLEQAGWVRREPSRARESQPFRLTSVGVEVLNNGRRASNG